MPWAPPKTGKRTQASLHRLIREGAEKGWTEKYLIRQLRQIVPLDERRRNAVTNYRHGLKELGWGKARIDRAVDRYSKKMREDRAKAILRTEQKKTETLVLHERINGPVVREWVAKADACAICKALHGQRRTGLAEYGDIPGPPAHPNCRCTEKIHPVRGGVIKAHDADKDGWVLEGTPLERPWRPGDTPSFHLSDKSKAAKIFDDLPGDTPVVLYHGRGKNGRVGDDISSVTKGDGLYVAPTPEDADFYVPKEGGEILAVVTLRKYVVPSPEAKGKTAGQALYDSFDGAMIVKGAPFVTRPTSKSSLGSVLPPKAEVKWTPGERGRNHSLRVAIPSEIGPLGLPIGGSGAEVGRISWRSDTGEIEAIQVEDGYKRQGIATALFHEAKRLAAIEGLVVPKHSVKQTDDGASWAANVGKAHDGDGDGFVYDGTPRMRPKGPGDTPRLLRSRRSRKASLIAAAHKRGRKPKPPEEKRKKLPPRPPTTAHVNHDIEYTLGHPVDIEGMQQAGDINRRRLKQIYQIASGGPPVAFGPYVEEVPGLADKMSEEEFIEEVVNAARTDLSDGDIVVRVPRGVLVFLSDDGRFRTQHEEHVASTSGVFDPEYRARFERDNMGVPMESDPTKRPVYGSMEVDGGFDVKAVGYGDVTLIMKEEVKERATVTLGDSLNYLSYPVPLSEVDTADEQRILAAVGEAPLATLARNVLASLSDDMVDDDMDSRELDEYQEVQIHGGLNMDEIDMVRPTRAGDDDYWPEQWAEENGIKYWDGI